MNSCANFAAYGFFSNRVFTIFQPTTMAMQCSWNACGLGFDDPLLLEDHAVDHIAHEFHLTPRPQCRWNSCDYPPHLFHVPYQTLTRHVRFHVFVEMLRNRSIELLNDLQLSPMCFTPANPTAQHVLSHLQCDWNGCNFVTDSFIMLDEHLLDVHAKSKICQWNSCSSPTLSIDHLRQHANLASFACASCLSLFPTTEKYMQHESALQVTTQLTELFFCEWLSCNAGGLVSCTELHRHCMTKHITSNDSCVCLWRGCPSSDLHNLVILQRKRHLLLHVFAESCRQAAVLLVKKYGASLGRCNSSVRGNMTDWFRHKLTSTRPDSVVTSGFKCLWYNCNQQYVMQFYSILRYYLY